MKTDQVVPREDTSGVRLNFEAEASLVVTVMQREMYRARHGSLRSTILQRIVVGFGF